MEMAKISYVILRAIVSDASTVLICSQPPLHQEKEKLGGAHRGLLEETDEQTAKEETRNETMVIGRTMSTSQEQTTATETNNRADKIRGNGLEVKLNSKDNSHNQHTGPEGIAAANSGRAVVVFRRTGETVPRGNLSRRLRINRRRLMRLRKRAKGPRNRRFLKERKKRRRKRKQR